MRASGEKAVPCFLVSRNGRNAGKAARRLAWGVVLAAMVAGCPPPDGVGAEASPAAWGPEHREKRSVFRQVQYQRGAAFDLRASIIPVGEIFSGGPPKDGIPALTSPTMLSAEEAKYLKPTDRVVGIVSGGVISGGRARAYPLKILNQHEVVNDRLGKLPVAVTYCPLCDSVVVFDRRTEQGEREFGVSGLLYNSNVLMYDRGGRPQSLWSQVMTRGVSGPAAGRSLKTLPVELTTWQDWRGRHPQTVVLSPQTGHRRNYQANPYRRYFASRSLMFPARPISKVLPTKSEVLGIWTGRGARAYPLVALAKTDHTLQEEIDGLKFTLQYNPRAKSVRVVRADEGLQWMYSFWFAWYAFHPQTEVFRAGR